MLLGVKMKFYVLRVGSLPAEQNELRITNTGSLKSMGTTKYFQNGLAQLVESFIKNYRIM
jgi:hypothetical protein